MDESLDDCNFCWEEGSLENLHAAVSHHQPPAAQPHEACRAECFTATQRDTEALLNPAGKPRHREPVTQLLNHLLKPLDSKGPWDLLRLPGNKPRASERLDVLPLMQCQCIKAPGMPASPLSPVGQHLVALAGWYHSPDLEVCSVLRSAPSVTSSKEGLATAYSSLI